MTACVYFGVAIDALLVEPSALVIREIMITTPKITDPITIKLVSKLVESFSKLSRMLDLDKIGKMYNNFFWFRNRSIVFCADMQSEQVGDYERRTLHKIKEQNADLILFGGDYVRGKDVKANRQLLDDWNRLFQEIDLQAPLGVFAIQGNKEIEHAWRDMFRETAIIPRGTTGTVQVGEVRITFLSVRSSWAKRTVVDRKVEDKFRIILGHMPVFSMEEQACGIVADETYSRRVGTNTVLGYHTHKCERSVENVDKWSHDVTKRSDTYSNAWFRACSG